MAKHTEKFNAKGPIAWMAGNSVAANLVMIVFLVGGLIMALNVKQEVFPEFSQDTVTMTISYPGASPEEVESGIVFAAEEALQGIDGVKEITSKASEGSASVTVEALEGADINKLWQDVESAIGRVTTFPDDSEEPEIAIDSHRREVVSLALYGPYGERLLRETAEQVRDALLQDELITQVELEGVRDYEIHVEIPQDVLRRYGLTLGEAAEKVAKASVESGGGSLKTPGGDILLRVNDRRRSGREYAHVPLVTDKDGGQLNLEDVAEVSEGFEENDIWATYNGDPAVLIEVYRVGQQTPIEVAEAARNVVKRINEELPGGLHLSVVRDMSTVYEERAELLLTNAFMGLAVVFICLGVFLEPRLAFWVSMGIPISFLGSFLILPFAGFSLNMITMFAFIVTLGIVVDDAIVVGENVYRHRRMGESALVAAVRGAREVAMPVTFSVLTNMVAFMPMFFIPGIMGKIFKTIPVVVVCVFVVSLVESLFVLPAHLAHTSKKKTGIIAALSRLQNRFSHWFEDEVRRRYGWFLEFCLRFKYAVIALGVAVLVALFGYIASGRMGIVLFPRIESNYAYVEAVLPYGSPQERMKKVEQQLVASAEKVVAKNGGDKLAEGIYSRVRHNNLRMRIFLTPADVRPLGTAEVVRLWRKATGSIPGLESISFESDRGGPGSGKALTVQLSHRDKPTLEQAGRDLAVLLTGIGGVSDTDDGSAKGKRQYDIKISQAGERMGLTSREVAQQIRHAFYGAEALKQQRGRNEVKVLVRLPTEDRATEATLDDLVLRTSDGGEILLRDAAILTPGQSYTTITHFNSRQVISVTADVTPKSRAESVVAMLKSDVLPGLLARYPGLSYSFEGHQADLRESLQSLFQGLLMAVMAIYALLAIPFRSYFQPLIIMCCIPFGVVGAILGHLFLGYSLSVNSLFGVVALSGVVVNDSLVLIDFANRRVRAGEKVHDSIVQAGLQRFRPIMLTTVTTFGGLAPMIFETSRQARFLIPMAISLGFGIVFATLITLVLVPCLYMVLNDVMSLFGHAEKAGAPTPEA